ncbi:MAG: DMT family transporter [Muribaculum sp.]|nr:DMT family transporter [Muribaculum sp.]
MGTSKRLSSSKYMTLLGHLGAIVTVSAWGTSFISTKVLMEDGGFTPMEMYVYRFSVGYLILLLFTFKKLFANSWRDELMLALSGVCAGSLYFMTENFALLFTSTGNVSLLSALSPIFTTILVGIFFKTRIAPGVIIGSLIALIGVAFVVFSHGEGIAFNPIGDILALSCALSWALYSIIAKNLIPKYTTGFITRKLFFYGVVSVLPVFFANPPEGGYHFMELFDATTPQYLANFLFLVLMCSLAAFVIWNEVMRILGPVTSNNYLYAQPIVTMVVAFFTIHEQITLTGYIGCALIIGGLIISDKLRIDKFKLSR